MGSEKWVFLINQWIFEELVQESKNVALNQNTGAEWTQGKLISKILFMSDVGMTQRFTEATRAKSGVLNL